MSTVTHIYVRKVLAHIGVILLKTRWLALDRGANSLQPFDHLQYFLHFVTLDISLFDLILIGVQELVMDYPCGKFGDCSFSRFDFIMWTDNTHTDTYTEAAKCFKTSAHMEQK